MSKAVFVSVGSTSKKVRRTLSVRWKTVFGLKDLSRIPLVGIRLALRHHSKQSLN